MSGNTGNPRVWINADVYVAPVGTTGPTDVSTVLNASFKALGLLSEDGMSESRSEDQSDMYAWGGILVRTTRSKHKRQIKVTAIEDNSTVFDLVNPRSTLATTGGVTTRTVNVPQSDPRSFVIQTVDTGGPFGAVTRRRYIPRGEVINVGDVAGSDSAMQMYELTINVYPSAAGVLYQDITNDGQAISGS